MELMNKVQTGNSLKELKAGNNDVKMLQQELFASKEIIKKLKNDIKQLKKTESEEKKRFSELLSENLQFKKQTDNYAMDHIEQKKLIRKLIAENRNRAENQSKSTEDLVAINEKQPDRNEEIARQAESFEIRERQLQDNLKVLEREIDLVKIENEKLSKSKQVQLDSFGEQIQELKNANKSYEHKLSMKSAEISELKKEFDSYKKRAQSILENQTGTDSCAEDKFREEIAFLKKELSISENQRSLSDEKISQLNSEINKLSSTKNEKLIELKRLSEERDEFRHENVQLQAELKNCKLELRQMNLKNAAVIDCYVQQTKDLETKLNVAQKELQEVKSAQPIVPLSPLSNQSSDCESLAPTTSDHNCNNQFENAASETNNGSSIEKERYEQRIMYLSNLLADTKQDLKKYAHMNKVLKEEIRKQEVSFEQNPSAENYTYLKHVIIKFLTLNNADEKLHLINVINTMLKLTDEEQKKLTEAVKGMFIANTHS